MTGQVERCETVLSLAPTAPHHVVWVGQHSFNFPVDLMGQHLQFLVSQVKGLAMQFLGDHYHQTKGALKLPRPLIGLLVTRTSFVFDSLDINALAEYNTDSMEHNKE